jgi:hypothetical protein
VGHGTAPAGVRRRRARRGREFPGELERIRVWFRDNKIPSGKPANAFAFEDQPLNKAFTLKVRAVAAVGVLRVAHACPGTAAL